MKLVCESLKELFEAQSRDDVIQDLGAEQEEWKHKILSQIKKIKPGETQSWRVIPFPRLKKIWNDFINTGIVRDTAGIDLFEKIITENTCKIWINNYLIGATPLAEYEDDLEEYGITAEEYELYNDWMCDEEGVDRTSDYGITPIHKLLIDCKLTDKYEEKLLLIDQILNITHRKSDLAKWFVEGGSRALSQLAGVEVNEEIDANEAYTDGINYSIDESFGHDKIAYYRFYKKGAKQFILHISGDTFGIKDVLKRNDFSWSGVDYAWLSSESLSKEEWLTIVPKLFEEIENAGYKIQIRGKMDKMDKDWLSFDVPGYEEATYPPIPDGHKEKVIIKKWHHYAPMTGVTGKGSRMIKDLLHYCDYNFTGLVWEKIYLSEEVDDMIEYLKQNNYTIDDQR